MSGGSYDYICFKIEEFSRGIYRQDTNPRRKAFASIVRKMAHVAHEIEWADSGDIGQEDADKSIDDFFSSLSVDGDKLIKAIAYDELSGILTNYLSMNK